MLFNAGNKISYPFEIQIDDISIERVYVFNFLGLIMDEHLNWKSHVEKHSNKCSKTIGVLNKLKYVLPQPVKLIYIYIGECVRVCLCVYPSKHIHVAVCGPIGTNFGTHMQIHLEKVVGKNLPRVT